MNATVQTTAARPPSTDRWSPAARQNFTQRSFIYFLIYCLFILPILRANYFYVDDINRDLTAYPGWINVGRPLADLLMKAINFNFWMISDLAPLPQLLAILVLALSSAWTSMALRLRSGLTLLPIAFIVCNPFFIENLSYRYDSFSMATAVATALLPIALETRTTPARYGFAIVASLMLTLNLYQPALNVFIVLACFTSLLDLRHADVTPTLRAFGLKIACLAIALILYRIESTFLPFEPYAVNHARFVSPPDLPAILLNIQNACRFMARNLLHTHQTQILLAAIALGFLAFIANLARRTQPFGTLLVACLLIVGMLAGAIGPEVLLLKPVWAPRVLIGFGALAACALALLVLECRQKILRGVAVALLAVTLAAQFSLVYGFGNLLIAQTAVDTVVANQIVNDAFSIAHGKRATLFILGRAPEPPNVALQTRWYPILHRLLPSHQKNFWTWGPLLKRNHPV